MCRQQEVESHGSAVAEAMKQLLSTAPHVTESQSEMEKVAPAKEQCGSSMEQENSAANYGELLEDSLEAVVNSWIQAPPTDNLLSADTMCFYSPRVPSVSLKHYIHRLHKFFHCSEECFILALIFLRRATKGSTSLVVCNRSVRRLLFATVMLAAKVHDDKSASNKYYAKVGGMPVAEVNKMELSMLQVLGWKTCVERSEYELYRELVLQGHNSPAREQRAGEPEPEP